MGLKADHQEILDLRNKFVALLKSGKRYPLRSCSICDYMMHYYSEDGSLCYDSSCNCASFSLDTVREWEELDFYFDPKHGHIDTLKKWVESSKEQS